MSTRSCDRRGTCRSSSGRRSYYYYITVVIVKDGI